MAYSAADLDLARRLVDSGHAKGREPESLAEQVRKWRTWRVLPTPTAHKGQGRGRGSTAGRYDDAAFAVAVGMLAASAVEPRSRHRAVLTAWWDGADVGTEALREALRVCLVAEVERKRLPGGWAAVAPKSTPRERKALERALTRAVGDMMMSTADLLSLAALCRHALSAADPAALDAIRQMLGDAEGLSELPVATPGDVAETTIGHGLSGREVPSDVMRSIAKELSGGAAVAAVESATRTELDAGRDRLRTMLDAGLWPSSGQSMSAAAAAAVVPFEVAAFGMIRTTNST